jgi:hypothetical protein
MFAITLFRFGMPPRSRIRDRPGGRRDQKFTRLETAPSTIRLDPVV